MSNNELINRWIETGTIIIGGGSDGGGWMVLPGGKIVKIPPREPLTALQDLIELAPTLVMMARNRSQRLSSKLATAQEETWKVAQSAMNALFDEMSSIAPEREKAAARPDARGSELAAVMLIGGVASDGGGYVITSDGKATPIDPWEPEIITRLLARFVAATSSVIDVSSITNDQGATIAVVA